jgi:hypothetical protein
MKLKKTLKIIAGLIVFITLPSVLFFGYLYVKYDEDIPRGKQGVEAEKLAVKMLDALDFTAYKKTNYIEWTFRNKHHYKWQKDKKICTVYWKDYKVVLHLNNPENSKVYVQNFSVKGEIEKELLEKAIDYFNNDSFWLVAPYKLFDPGVERRLVTLENGDDALLVTYTTGGSTPGDSYLWILYDNGKPKSFKMWTSILPLKGVEASWSDWITTKSGAQLPSFHHLLFFGLEMGEVKGTE